MTVLALAAAVSGLDVEKAPRQLLTQALIARLMRGLPRAGSGQVVPFKKSAP